MEWIILLVIIGLQLYFSYRTWERAERLKRLFPDKSEASYQLADHQDTELKVKVIRQSSGWEEGFKEIVSDTNEYLVKSAGAAANLDTVQAIAERADHALDQETAAGVSLPLYIGLLGTMASIIAGLWGIEGALTQDNLESILAAVKIALIGSVLGLALTIIASVVLLRPARTERDRRKGAYLTFLQTNLQTVLGADLTSAIRNLDAQFRSFDRQLIIFNRNFASETQRFEGAIGNYAKQIRTELEGNLHSLQHGFQGHINKFQRSTEQLLQESAQAAHSLHDSLQLQQEIVADVRDLDVANLASLNAKSAQKLKSAADAVNTFQAYQEQLQEITKQTTQAMSEAKGTFQIVAGLKEEVGTILNTVSSRLTETEALFQFLQQEMSALREIKDTNREALQSLQANNVRVLADQEKHLDTQGKTFGNFLEKSYETQADLLRTYSAKAEQELKATLNGFDFERLTDDVSEVKQLVQNGHQSSETSAMVALLQELVAGNQRLEELVRLQREREVKGKPKKSNAIKEWFGRIFKKK